MTVALQFAQKSYDLYMDDWRVLSTITNNMAQRRQRRRRSALYLGRVASSDRARPIC